MLPQLQERIPIERSQMRLRLTVPAAAAADARGMLLGLDAVMEGQDRAQQGAQVSSQLLRSLAPKGELHAQRQVSGVHLQTVLYMG